MRTFGFESIWLLASVFKSMPVQIRSKLNALTHFSVETVIQLILVVFINFKTLAMVSALVSCQMCVQLQHKKEHQRNETGIHDYM